MSNGTATLEHPRREDTMRPSGHGSLTRAVASAFAVVAILTLSVVARADDTALVPRPPVVDGPGSGIQLSLDPFAFALPLGANSSSSSGGTTTTVSAASIANPSVAVGYQFSQTAFLFQAGILSEAGGAVTVEVLPTFRRYLSPLHTGTVVPFFDVDGAFAYLAPSSGSGSSGSSGAAAFAGGGGLGVGGEWLFTRNMGLEAYATALYLHYDGGGSFTLDQAVLEGKLGVVVHL
jgi:hypothetical protein